MLINLLRFSLNIDAGWFGLYLFEISKNHHCANSLLGIELYWHRRVWNVPMLEIQFLWYFLFEIPLGKRRTKQ